MVGIVLRWAAGALILFAAVVAAQLQLAPVWVPVAYLVLGVVSFGIYGLDKRAARRGEWRVPESTLHGIDLIGGIAGGLVGQGVFRHKTRKADFVAATGLIASGHFAALGLLALGFWRVPKVVFFA